MKKHYNAPLGWLTLAALLSSISLAQTDTTRHGWPITPFFSTHPITGVFCEFRNTGSADHFHNGVDIPKPDGSPVYPVYNGTVTSLSSTGSNAFVRVRYNVSGLVKSDAYVHINPSPLLNVGDSVFAYQTVLGTIISGQGHVHFTHGLVGAEMNAIRGNGGLTPYIDNYPPRVEWVRFYMDETNTQFPGNRLSGLVDIRSHLRETNAADPSDVRSSTSNNGTYIAGYKVLSADRSTVVYEPPSGGVRYRFDSKPSNAYVARVFAPGSDLSTHIYTLTNGTGADAINQTGIVSNNAWNTLAHPVGNYVVMVFAQDTRGLADTVYSTVEVVRPDDIPPLAPRLQSVIHDSTNRFTVKWYPNTEPDLMGYRLYFSVDGTNWTLKENEARLGSGSTSISYTLTSSGAIYFRLAAVDSASPSNVSPFSDVYGVRLNYSTRRTLIVDGFDRREPSGSYHEVSHPFAMTVGRSLPTNFSMCANEAVTDGLVALHNFDVVIWLLGDESVTDKTFDSSEQAIVSSYLQSGGQLLVTGSDVAWDLDRPSGPSQGDRDFMHNFLKARYAGDNANEYSVTGAGGTFFDDVSLRYGIVSEGSPYEEDSPDHILPENGSTPLLYYGTPANSVVGAVGFKGVFSGGTLPGAVVYLAFPFETITSKANRDTLMGRLYQYFNTPTDPTGIGGTLVEVPGDFELHQNYPNPFNPTTAVLYALPVETMVTIKVFDSIGQLVATIVNERKPAGTHTAFFNANGLGSGVYFYRMIAGSFTATKKLLVVR